MVMEELKDAVLEAVRGTLPLQMQLLEDLLAMPDAESRRAKLDSIVSQQAQGEAVEDGDESQPRDPPLVQLYYVANQLIEEMESREVVPDVRLLARMCLVSSRPTPACLLLLLTAGHTCHPSAARGDEEHRARGVLHKAGHGARDTIHP